MNYESIADTIKPEIQPEYFKYEQLLQGVPTIYWNDNITADDIQKSDESDDDIKANHEIAQMIINAFNKLDPSDQTAEWVALKERGEQLKDNIEKHLFN